MWNIGFAFLEFIPPGEVCSQVSGGPDVKDNFEGERTAGETGRVQSILSDCLFLFSWADRWVLLPRRQTGHWCALDLIRKSVRESDDQLERLRVTEDQGEAMKAAGGKSSSDFIQSWQSPFISTINRGGEENLHSSFSRLTICKQFVHNAHCVSNFSAATARNNLRVPRTGPGGAPNTDRPSEQVWESYGLGATCGPF